jgi:pSer/pThr/pTyr-binding forkhead associated (FHA) protein
VAVAGDRAIECFALGSPASENARIRMCQGNCDMSVETSGFKLRAEADGTETPVRSGMTVGRGDDCDLVIKLGVVSRQHARFKLVDNALWVEDLGSTNGTTVNGEAVTSATRVKPSDIICFDDVAYQVLAAGAAPAAAAAPERERDRTIVGARPLPSADAALKTVQSAMPARAPADAPVALPPAPAVPLPAQPRRPAPEPISAPGIPLSWAESDRLEAASHTQALPALLRQISQKTGDTEGLIEAARAHCPVRQPRLIGLNHAVAGEIFGLDVGAGNRKWELGRDAGADIRILDESVSGRHAQLVFEDGRWKVVNLMSVNGTFVNGRKVLSAYLKTADKIRLGNVELAFDAGVGGSAPQSNSASGGGLWSRLRGALLRLFGRR